MGRTWTVRDGKLAAGEALRDGGAGCPGARVILAGVDHIARHVRGHLVEEVLSQMDHAAVPLVECDGERAAGIVVLPAGAGKASAAKRFGFALEADGLYLFDGSGVCEPVLERMVADGASAGTPAAVLCALLRSPLREHPAALSRVRDDLELLEERILEGRERIDRARMMADTRRLLGLDVYYQGLSDIAATLAEEGAARIEAADRARFAALARQLDRLSTRLESLQQYGLEVHSLYQESIDVRQNNVMQWLTVVATIAMPLTFITGWYGMNFPNIPLVNVWWGYPVAAGICVVVAAAEIAVFHRCGWLRFSDRAHRRGGPGRDARRR